MKRFTFLSFLIVLFSCSSNSQTYSNLKPKDFKAEIEQNAGIILDVRTPNEVSTGQIENASTIDFYDKNFKDKIAKIQKDKTVYVYCKSGGRSSKVAQLLVEAGRTTNANPMLSARTRGGSRRRARNRHRIARFEFSSRRFDFIPR